MKKNLLLITIIILLFSSSGCNLFQKKNKSPIQFIDFKIKQNVNSSIDIIKNSTKEIEESANTILKIAQEIQISEEIQENIKSIIDNAMIIKEENINIKSTISSLKIVVDKIDEIEKISKEIENERNILSKKLEEAELSAKAETRKLLQRIIFLSIAGFGISVALLFLGSTKMGLVGISGSLATLILSIVVNQHIVIISYIGLIAIVLIILYLIYEGYLQKKIKRQLVETTELVKSNLSVEKKKEIFGEKSKIKRIQDITTINEVRKIKSKLKK